MVVSKKKGKENTVLREYVLPDYTQIKRGYVKVRHFGSICVIARLSALQIPFGVVSYEVVVKTFLSVIRCLAD